MTSTGTGSRVYLIRHGQTPLNAAGVLRGHLDPPLDEVGQLQARRLGQALRRQDVRLIVSSPLRRALQTADAIAEVVELPVTTDARLIDRDYGTWAGSRPQDIRDRFGSLDAAPGVEPADEVSSRACRALAEIAVEASGGAAAVVSHDAVIRMFLGAVGGLLQDADQLPQETGCMNTLEHHGGRWHVISVNELPGGPGGDDTPDGEPPA